ncbi:extracellular solute-binding protein [Eubacteriales bacterium OttesenSCG-928-G02]|nr:extracellular solute-binding protein [Eubacteriales bacterium OttesenSCG-928-G02]
MKKYFTIILTLILATSLLISCSGNTDNNSTAQSDPSSENNSKTEESSGTSDGSNEYQDDKGYYVSKVEIKDFQKREFRVLVRETTGIYSSMDFTIGSEYYDETIDEAVVKRNQIIEDRHNIVLVPIKSTQIQTDIRAALTNQTDDYDAVMPTVPMLTTLAAENYLYDLKELDYIDLNAPWWDPNATKAFSFMNKVYFAIGDITISNKVCSPSILFNKDMIKVENLEDPYQLVVDKKWTYDKLYEMAKKVTKELDGETGMTGNDQWGLLASPSNALSFYAGSGELLCVKNNDDIPELSFGKNQRAIDIASKIIDDMISSDTWVVYSESFPAPIWDTSLAAFYEGRILFRPSAFSATTKLRAYNEFNFGILPPPMWDEDQDNYYSYCGTGEVTGIAIPKSCADPEFAAYMCEVFACEAKNYLTEAYMEVNLKIKDARDEESLPMLKIIFDNLVYDTGEVYNFGGISGLFGKIVESKNNTLTSSFQEIEDAVKSDIQKLYETYTS